jgi:hypothetical protein
MTSPKNEISCHKGLLVQVIAGLVIVGIVGAIFN